MGLGGGIGASEFHRRRGWWSVVEVVEVVVEASYFLSAGGVVWYVLVVFVCIVKCVVNVGWR
jgi:hypothetical protein